MKLTAVLIPTTLLLLAGTTLAQDTKPKRAKKPNKWAQHYWKRVAAFKQENRSLTPGKKYVVLLGSSSTEGWKYSRRVKRFLPGVSVLNRGITADTIGYRRNRRGILRRLESSVFDCQPSHVFLLNGRNNLGRGKTSPIKKTAATYRKVVESIKKRLPKVVVCIVTCAPVNLRYKGMAPHLIKYNQALRKIARDLRCPLIDLFALLKGPRGLLPKTHTRDGLHFNDKGYKVLGREILRVLKGSKKTKTPKTPKAKQPKRILSEDSPGIGGSIPTK